MTQRLGDALAAFVFSLSLALVVWFFYLCVCLSIEEHKTSPAPGPCYHECSDRSLTTRGAIADQMECNYCLEQQRSKR